MQGQVCAKIRGASNVNPHLTLCQGVRVHVRQDERSLLQVARVAITLASQALVRHVQYMCRRRYICVPVCIEVNRLS